MATSPVTQIDPDSLDSAGISVATAVPDAAHPRRGSVYDPAVLAAAVPVWFHPCFDGRYLMLATRTWTAAAPSGGHPGIYTSHTEDTTPAWFLLDGPTGARAMVPNAPVHIPMHTGIDAGTAVLTAAASRPPGYLYLLNSVLIDGHRQAVLQYFIANPGGAIVLGAEEVIPTVTVGSDTVVFDKGLQFDTPYLVAYGTDPTGKIYRARKPWGRVGANTVRSASPQVFATVVGSQLGWEYFTGTGYSTTPTDVGQLLPKDDSTTTTVVTALTTVGPLSFVGSSQRVLMSTVSQDSGTYTGALWISRAGRPFTKVAGGLALGDTTSYLGLGIALQPQLSSTAGVPYVSTTKEITGDGQSLHTHWATFAVS